MTNTKTLTLVHYSADQWGHVCPVVRVNSPANQGGFRLLRGNEWLDGSLHIYPERVGEADLVIIQRDFPRNAQAYDEIIFQAEKHGKPVVYELDDLLFDLPEIHPDYEQYKGVRGPVLEAAASANAVICTTPALQAHLRHVNSRVYVWPNYLDDTLWTLQQPVQKENRPLVIGYLGSHSHKPDLDYITPVLESLLTRFGERLLLRLWGMQTPARLSEFKNVESVVVGLVDYSAFTRYFIQQECDVVVAPLLDNPFNHSKSSLKFLEYSALGVPGVYSRVTPYENIVQHGETGFLAENLEEWEENLLRLLEAPQLRFKIGSAAQELVRREWMLSKHVSKWASMIRNLHAEGRASVHSPESRNLTRRFLIFNREDQEIIDRLRKDKEEKERQIERLQQTLRISQEQFALVKHDLDEITHSTGWKMLEAFYAWRMKVAPKNSRRERGMHLTIGKLRGARRRMYALMRRMNRSRSAVYEQLPGAAMPVPKKIAFSIVPGEPSSLPAISVVIEKNVLIPNVDEEAVLEWVAGQTLKAVEVVLWDRSSNLAKDLTNSSKHWPAEGMQELAQHLGAHYLCLASQDLISQSSVYLEANWVALESAGLAFTMNVNGYSDWPVRHLHRNTLAGARVLPLFRQVVRKEYICNDFSLDLNAWASSRQGAPGIIGRVLHHTSAQPDDESSIPFEIRFRGVEIVAREPYLLGRTDSSLPWEPLIQPLFSPEHFWPVSPEPNPLPTIFLVQPFLAVGGAEDLALNIITNLKDRARFVVIAADPLEQELGTTADAYRKLTPYVYNLPDYLESELRLPYLMHMIERFQPETFYIHNGSPWVYDVLPEIKKRFPKLRIVNQVYDSQIGFINRYDDKLVEVIDAHIGTNKKICAAYVEKGVSPEKSLQVEHGILAQGFDPGEYPPERIAQLRGKFGLRDGQCVITFASRLHPQKRPLDFLEIARRFKSDPDLFFFIFGDGPLAGVVEEQIAQLSLNNIRRYAFYRPISDVLAMTDVLVLPSEYEGMPLIISQAQLMGKPVVVTEVGNNAEVLDVTGGGVVTPVGDVGALVRGIQSMLAKKPDPARMRRELLAHYGIDVIAEKYWKALLPNR